jgi:hypothetical protein
MLSLYLLKQNWENEILNKLIRHFLFGPFCYIQGVAKLTYAKSGVL